MSCCLKRFPNSCCSNTPHAVAGLQPVLQERHFLLLRDPSQMRENVVSILQKQTCLFLQTSDKLCPRVTAANPCAGPYLVSAPRKHNAQTVPGPPCLHDTSELTYFNTCMYGHSCVPCIPRPIMRVCLHFSACAFTRACMYVFISICGFACLPVCLFACLPACLPAGLPACLPACLAGWLAGCLSVCLSVCLSLCMLYVCIYLCMHVHVCLLVCMHACMYVSMHACMHACMYVCMYACMYACMHASMYLKCLHIYASEYLCTYVSA